MRSFIVIILLILIINPLKAQLARETRAVWLTTNFRLDWPPRSYDAADQMTSLVNTITDIKRKNLNTIYFQVRSNGTVMFKSSFEPYSPYLKGEVNLPQSYDPLDYAVYLAHKRGLEIHAWVNVVRCFSGEDKYIFNHPDHIAQRFPQWVVKVGENGKTTYWLDPGLPEVREYLVELFAELVENYDVDGLHLDFLRYPDSNFDDSFSYSIYGNGMPKADWRRNNLTLFIAELNQRIKSVKPYVKIGVTPFGIYKNLKDAYGTEAFNNVFQPSRQWLEDELIDYVTPQIYWDINANPRFDVLARDWKNNSFGRNVVLGIAAYKPEVFDEMDEMIRLSRSIGAQGVAFFRYGNIKGHRFSSFRYKTYPSAMAWIDEKEPQSPINLSYNIRERNPFRVTLDWEMPPSNGNNHVEYYSLYNLNSPGDIPAADDLFEIIDAENQTVTLAIDKPHRVKYHFTLKAVDKLWNESPASSNIVNVTIPELEKMLTLYYLSDKPALIKRKDGSVKILLFCNKDETISIAGGNGGGEENLFKDNLNFGKNIISLSQSINELTYLKIHYEFSGREVILDL